MLSLHIISLALNIELFIKWSDLMKYGYKNDCLHHVYRNLQHICPMISNLLFHMKNLRAHFLYLNHKSWRRMCFCKPCFCSHISYMVSPNFEAARLFMRMVNSNLFISINIFIGSFDKWFRFPSSIYDILFYIGFAKH